MKSKLKKLALTWLGVNAAIVVVADRVGTARQVRELQAGLRHFQDRADRSDERYAKSVTMSKSLLAQLDTVTRERDTAVAELERLRGEVNGTDVLRARIITIVTEAGDEGVTRGPIMAKLSRPQREHAGAMLQTLVAEGALVEQPTEHSTRYVAVAK